jgi:hypothetical protein
VSKHFNYYDDWQSVELECPICHWMGKFNEGSVGYSGDLQDCSCPKCDFLVSPVLAIVSYPTNDEMLASGSPGDIQKAKERQQFLQNFNLTKLVSKEQLPAVDSKSFDLVWDFVESENEQRTVIRHGDYVLFSEPALWEGYERFEQVCKIVQEKYGVRVKDLVPTHRSELYLYGDVLSSPTFVDVARQTIFGSKEQSSPPRPELQCPECAFGNESPEHLAKHLIESHNYSIKKAWFAVGQENERLYPRFRAPAGEFSVLGVDKAHSGGAIIATCTRLNDAIAAAVQEAESYPEISVHDDSGNELYVVLPKPTDETKKREDLKRNKTADKTTDKSKNKSKPRKIMIVTLPTHKKRPPKQP